MRHPNEVLILMNFCSFLNIITATTVHIKACKCGIFKDGVYSASTKQKQKNTSQEAQLLKAEQETSTDIPAASCLSLCCYHRGKDSPFTISGDKHQVGVGGGRQVQNTRTTKAN